MGTFDQVDRILSANQAYAGSHHGGLPAQPARALAVLTCMDTRIDVLAALGLAVGEAHILRNAGARFTSDVARSLALSSHVLGVRTVVLMQHTACGLAGATNQQLQEVTGARIDFLPIDDHRAAIEADLAELMGTPALGAITEAVGLVFDVETGMVTEVARSSRAD